VVGVVVAVVGVVGAVRELPTEALTSWVRWLVGLVLVNDLVVLPLVALVGVGVTRLPLGRVRAPVQAGLFATAVALALAWPGLAGTAEASDNPTIQPIDYRTATLTVLAVVWAAVGVWAVVRWRRPPTEG
jgi:hypothetical protein